MQDQERMPRLQLCLPQRYITVLKREARRCGVSLAEVIRDLLRDSVDEIENQQRFNDRHGESEGE